jgi:co-chaperonin GroES (HSP10)
MEANMRKEIDPVHNQILFQFVEDTTRGKFNEKSNGGILLVEDSSKQVEHCRWGTVVSTGPNVKDVVEGEVILINALMWTNGFRMTDTDYWITSEPEIIAKWGDGNSLPS